MVYANVAFLGFDSIHQHFVFDRVIESIEKGAERAVLFPVPVSFSNISFSLQLRLTGLEQLIEGPDQHKCPGKLIALFEYQWASSPSSHTRVPRKDKKEHQSGHAEAVLIILDFIFPYVPHFILFVQLHLVGQSCFMLLHKPCHL